MNDFELTTLSEHHLEGALDLLDQLSDCPYKISPEDSWELYVDDLTQMIVVAEYKGTVIGTGKVIIEQKLRGDCVAHIEDVVVEKKYRGLGIGRQIVDYLCELAIDSDCSKVVLHCLEENVDFYKNCGFTQENGMRKDLV